MRKEGNLDKAFKEIEKEYSQTGEDGLKKSIENLEKEIAGKEKKIEQLNGKDKEELSQNVEKSIKRLENLRGYQKNGNQIKRIKDFKKVLETKLINVTKERDDSKKAYEKSKKLYDKIQKNLQNDKNTMKLDNFEYNNLVIESEKAKKEMNHHKEMLDKANNKIIELKGKIGKCDLAWRTLFTNKTWDEIQKRAMSEKERFTRKIDKDEKISNKSMENSKDDKIMKEHIGNEVSKIVEENKNDKALVEYKETKNPLKKLWSKIKQKLSQVKEKISKSNENKIEDKIEDKKDDRDKFLEGLRIYADVEYAKEVKEAKKKESIKMHEVKIAVDKGREPGDD